MSRQMKDSGIEWIGKIPEEWRVCRTKDVCTLYTGNSIKDEEKELYEDSNEARPYIATKHIDATLGTVEYENGMYVKLADTDFKIAAKGCTLMCIEGGSAGKKKAIIDREVSFVNKLCCFAPKSLVNEYFLYYFLSSPGYEEEFRRNLSGLIGGVSVSQLKTIPMLIAPIDEQIRIAEYLKQKCGYIDSVMEKTKTTIEEYKKLKQAIVTKAVTRGIKEEVDLKECDIEHIGRIPSGWEVIKIKWLLNERKERSEEGKEEPLSMSQKYGLIPTKEMDSIPNMASSFVGAKLVQKKDLVFNKLKAHLGVFAVSKFEGLVSPDYAVYFATGKAHVKFLEYLFKTPQYINEFKKKSSGVGAGLTRLYSGDLYSIYSAIPPMSEQIEIIEYIDSKVIETNELISKKEAFLEELERFKKSLIFEYVTGKKEVPKS